jgi:SAM-dependent methyltransferase
LDRQHPFDRANGTDTSGVVYLETIRAETDHPALAHAAMYAGSQPSIVRAALNALPPMTNATFLDVGCGKGRPLLVATEFPFRTVIGVELSPGLGAIARANAAIVAARHPARAPVRIEIGDATEYPLPPGDLVVFFYNSFGAPLVAKLVSAVERAIAAANRQVYFVYYNPVHGNLFDASPLLVRRWARMVECAREDRAYGFELAADAVVIWQGSAGAAPPPPSGVDTDTGADIVVTNGGARAELRRLGD